jgi:hypothetical protein
VQVQVGVGGNRGMEREQIRQEEEECSFPLVDYSPECALSRYGFVCGMRRINTWSMRFASDVLSPILASCPGS